MHNTPAGNMLIFIVVCTILILLLIFFITMIIYRYQQNQNIYLKNLEEIKAIHSSALLQSQIEMQDTTFQRISREIHDNIGQKLSLAKLHLNTLQFTNVEKTTTQVEDVVTVIGHVINDLSDISRSLSSDLVLQNGFIKGLEYELDQIKKSGDYRIDFLVEGDSLFLEESVELVLFRLCQEILHNIVKHAGATAIEVLLHFGSNEVMLRIEDNGKGFELDKVPEKGAGLKNMHKRAELINSRCIVKSVPGYGTNVTILIPIV